MKTFSLHSGEDGVHGRAALLLVQAVAEAVQHVLRVALHHGHHEPSDAAHVEDRVLHGNLIIDWSDVVTCRIAVCHRNSKMIYVIQVTIIALIPPKRAEET